MSLTSNANDIAFTSRFVTDKIVAVYEGTINTNTAPTLGGGFYAYKPIDHGFTRSLLLKSQFSKDGNVWSDENSYSPFEATSAIGIAYSTISQVIVLLDAGIGTIYYRVIAFWIDNYDDTNPAVPPTQGSHSDVYFDSRTNYQKIKSQALIAMNGRTSESRTITHSLGYEPNVRVFVEMLPGQLWPANFGGTKNHWLFDSSMVECEPMVYTDRLVINLYGNAATSPLSVPVYYIIYYDA